jgi:DNA-binding MarR family transcriptional regulator
VSETILANDHLQEHVAPYDGRVSAGADDADPQVRGAGCDEALADDLGWGLGVVFRAYVKAAHEAVAELPGGPRGYQVLASAAQSAVGSQLALAQHLGIDRTVMTYLLDDLENAGLIARRPDPADRRARRIVATEHGIDLLVTLDARLREAEAHLLDPLGEESQRLFRAQLRALATRLNALDPLDSPCELAEQVDAALPTTRSTTRTSRR